MAEMKRCPHIYKAMDKRVREGKSRVGEQCAAPAGSEKQLHYCYGHYKTWAKEHNPEINKLLTAEAVEKRYRKNNQIREGAAVSEDNPYGISEETIAALGLNKKFDLEMEYALYKRINLDPTQEFYDEKYAFAKWLDTPEHLRIPKEIEEVARILGMSKITLSFWKSSPEVVKIISQNIKNNVRMAAKVVMYRLTEKALAGDNKSTEMFLKLNEKIEEKEDRKPEQPHISEDLMKKADEICGDKKMHLEGVSFKTENAVVFDAISKGNVKESDN